MPADKTILINGNKRIKSDLFKLDKVKINKAEIESLPEISVKEKVKDNGL
ncbi:MAG TPA: hypothetical protein VKN64_07730 [Halanaerobiales bacterium]|nr:hypothetical protein [Halanaerobiales bacterium]